MLRTLTIAAFTVGICVAIAGAQVLFPLPPRAAARTRPTTQQLLDEFVRIEKIARLEPAQRVRRVPALYADEFVALADSVSVAQMISSSLPPQQLLSRERIPDQRADYGAELESVVATMTPEQVADLILNIHGQNVLRMASLERLKFVLAQHTGELDRLIAFDLVGDDAAAYRGFLAISQMRLEEFVNQMMAMTLEGGPRADQALRSLGWISSNPAAAKPLLDDLAKNPANTPRYYPLLRIMLFNQPADPTIVKLLDSQDDSIRGAAAIILEEASNATAVDLIPQLLLDPALQVRLSALRKAFRLTPDLFIRVREYVVGRLRSDVLEERIQVASALAQKQDGAGARVLLEALKDQNFPTGLRGQAGTAAANLMNATGARSGSTYLRMPSNAFDPSNPQAAENLAAFEKWVREHPDAVK